MYGRRTDALLLFMARRFRAFKAAAYWKLLH